MLAYVIYRFVLALSIGVELWMIFRIIMEYRSFSRGFTGLHIALIAMAFLITCLLFILVAWLHAKGVRG